MLKVLATSPELESAQKAFVSSVQTIPHKLVPTNIGHQGGNVPAEVVWLSTLGIWACLDLPPAGKSERKRFWNAFGIGSPDNHVSIVCEINPSREGVNRHTNGAFVVDDKGQLLICHRGKFTVAGGMKKEYFRRQYQGDWLKANEGTKLSTFIRVGQLDSAELGESLRKFVREVDRIKKLARSN